MNNPNDNNNNTLNINLLTQQPLGQLRRQQSDKATKTPNSYPQVHTTSRNTSTNTQNKCGTLK